MLGIAARLNEALEGRYRIERELGEGGMATVFLANDLKHGRQVALKVLKPELAAVVGGDRFLGEIRTTANLQHPHILPLFDSGEADGFLYFVMPFVEGETLRELLDRERQLPVDKALHIARAVGNALHVAHEAGVVHRDIKPGNILMSSGEPFVADFGIALAVGAASGSRLTETGLSIGTPFYMSPEQATGDQTVGPASDVFSLACVLYEMLTGEPPYQGSTAQAILGKIIQSDPVSAAELRGSVPPHVDAAIRKALERVPADRFLNAQAFVRALGDTSFRHGHTQGGAEAPGVGLATPASRLLAMTTVVLLFVSGWALTRGPDQPETRRHVIAEMWGGQSRAIGAYTALAPDGSGMVFARLSPGGSNRQLYYKPANASESIVLSGTDQAQNVVYAPDGRRIAFAVGNSIKTRNIPDGVAVTVAEDASSTMIGLAWMDDGTLLYEVENQTVVRIPDVGGPPDTLGSWSGAQQLSYIGAIEGSRGALVTVCPAACQDGSELHVIDLETREARLLLDDVIRAWALPTGHLMYVRGDRAVFAAPFDRGSLTLDGAGIPLFEDVELEISTPELTVAADGTMLYRAGAPSLGSREVVWVDRTGAMTPVPLPLDLYNDVSLDPTGQRLAVSNGDGANPGLWVKQLPDGPLTRVIAPDERGGRADWSNDGERLAFVDASDQAWETRADGSVARSLLLSDGRGVREVQHLGETGPYLVRIGTGPTSRLGLAEAGADSVALLLDPEYSMRMGRVSPDGRWLAYVSEQSGMPQVFVRPFPDLNGQIQISTSEGSAPLWNSRRQELFFSDGGVWTSVSYEEDPFFTVTDRTPLFTLSDVGFWTPGTEWRGVDVAPDGDRFVLLRTGTQGVPGEDVRPDVVLVEGFFSELEARFVR